MTVHMRRGPCTWSRKFLMFATGFGTVALGVARTALDAAIDIAGKKVPAKRNSILRDTSTTQRQIGEAEARWRSARAFSETGGVDAVGAARARTELLQRRTVSA